MNRKNVWKRVTAITIIIGILAGMLSGCSKTSENSKGQTAKGRYMEQEIELPEHAGNPLGMIRQDRTLVLYTSSSGEESYQSYAYADGQWSGAREETWLADAKNRSGQEAVEVFGGRDGNLYARTESAEGMNLLKKGENGAAEEVTLRGDGDNKTTGFSDAVVLKDGTIGIGNYVNGMVEFYKDGKVTFSTEGIQAGSEEQVMLEANDETVAIIDKDGRGITFYDAADFEKKNTVALEQQFGEGFLIPGANGTWYVVNAKGIYRIQEEGSICERIMDGGNGMMSNNTTWFLRRFLCGEEESFYGLYSNANQNWKLMQYAYDQDAATVQEQTLSVYSLREHDTVRQAVHEFQSRHPEVRVEYLTAVTGEEQPTADHIRTLNTELLSGKGADVLILDGLPIASYLEKGVLLDLTETAGKLKTSGVLKNIIENTAQKDGSIYAVPARVNIPVLLGSEEERKACESMDAMKAYVQNNPDKRLFGATSHDLIWMTLFHLFYEELEKEGGGIREEALSGLLDVWLQICENGDFKKYESNYFDGEGSLWPLLDRSFCSAQEVFGQKECANITELAGLNSLQTPYTSARKTGAPPQSLKGYYVPKIIAGVNGSSRQPELAKAFVECLVSKEVQQTDNWEGLPVLRSVLDTYPDYVESKEGQKNTMGYSGIDVETGERFEETLTYPTKKEMEDLITMMEEATSPFLQDRIISDTVLTESEKCYQGKQSPEETAKAICQKVDLYLSE